MDGIPHYKPLDIIYDEAWVQYSRIRAQITVDNRLIPGIGVSRDRFIERTHHQLSDHVLHTAMSRAVTKQAVGAYAVSYNLDCVVYTATDFQKLMQEQYDRGFRAAQLQPMEAPKIETRKPVDLAEGGE